MGFGTSVTQAIFFIASVLVALAIVGAATISINSLANSFGQKAGELSDQIKTEIKITGDACYLGGSTNVYVKNTGSSFLEANSTNIFLGGSALGVEAIHLFKNNAWTEYSTQEAWGPGQLARFTLSSSLPIGYNRLMVVTQYGTYDQMEYSDC